MEVDLENEEERLSALKINADMLSEDDGSMEDNDNHDISANGNGQELVGRKKKKSKRSLIQNGLSKLTPKEISQLRETENLYQSNLYRFQVNHILYFFIITYLILSI